MLAPPTTSLFERFADLKLQLTARSAALWEQADPTLRYHDLSEFTFWLTGELLSVGEVAQQNLAEESPESPEAYFIVYVWLDRAKDVAVLLRNSCFEQHRTDLLNREDRITPHDLTDFFAATQQAIHQAITDLVSLPDNPAYAPEMLERRIRKWHLEHSPWPVLREQFALLLDQEEILNGQVLRLEETEVIFRRIRAHFAKAFSGYLAYLKELAAALAGGVSANDAPAKESGSAAGLKALRKFTDWAPRPETSAVFIDQLRELTDALPEGETLIIGTEAGLLQRRPSNLAQDTAAWIQSELMSEVQEFYNRREQITNRLLIALRTGENRRESARQEGQDLLARDITHSLEQLRNNLQRSAEKIRALEQETAETLRRELTVAKVLNPDFLQLNLQQTLSQYRRYQQSGVAELSRYLRSRAKQLFNKGRSSLVSENLSEPERIVRLLDERKPQAAAAHYTGMFINAGFLGESFWVGRSAELKRVEDIVAHWRQGVRGAVLLSGSRHSGKSFFAEMIGHRFFNNDFVHLRPNARLSLAGRTLEPTEDLETALQFVVANGRRERKMVLIDDLAGWQDQASPLASDVGSLLRHLDVHGNQLFWVVTTDSSLHQQLQLHFRIERYFQATLPLKRLSVEEITEAILIRHGATQTQLTDETGKELTTDQLRQKIGQITQGTHGHIGEALRRWAYAVRAHDADGIRLKKGNRLALTAPFSKDAGVLLRAILVERHCSEYQLRKQFGPLFRDRFQPLTQRFLQLGLLVRHPDGNLSINPALASELERELRHQSFLPRKATPTNEII